MAAGEAERILLLNHHHKLTTFWAGGKFRGESNREALIANASNEHSPRENEDTITFGQLAHNYFLRQ